MIKKEDLQKLQFDNEYVNALLEYQEFKKLRQKMGKPIRGFGDRERITSDLFGEKYVSKRKNDREKKSRYPIS